MPLRHYQGFYDSLQLVLYSFFWRRRATGVLAFCSLLPSPPVQWKICSLTPLINTLASSSDVSVLGHGRKLHLYTQLDEGLHLSSILQNFILMQIHFCSFQLFLTFKKKAKHKTNQPQNPSVTMLWWAPQAALCGSHTTEIQNRAESCAGGIWSHSASELCRNHPKEDSSLQVVSLACCGRVF